jgi:hypothetical protein
VQILLEALQGFGEAAAHPSTGWALRRVASEVEQDPVRSVQYSSVAYALHVSFRLLPFYGFLSKRISKQTQMHERLLMFLS